MNLVSNWIQSCVAFSNSTTNPSSDDYANQQQHHMPYRHQLRNLQHSGSNDMLVTVPPACSPSTPASIEMLISPSTSTATLASVTHMESGSEITVLNNIRTPPAAPQQQLSPTVLTGEIDCHKAAIFPSQLAASSSISAPNTSSASLAHTRSTSFLELPLMIVEDASPRMQTTASSSSYFPVVYRTVEVSHHSNHTTVLTTTSLANKNPPSFFHLPTMSALSSLSPPFSISKGSDAYTTPTSAVTAGATSEEQISSWTPSWPQLCDSSTLSPMSISSYFSSPCRSSASSLSLLSSSLPLTSSTIHFSSPTSYLYPSSSPSPFSESSRFVSSNSTLSSPHPQHLYDMSTERSTTSIPTRHRMHHLSTMTASIDRNQSDPLTQCTTTARSLSYSPTFKSRLQCYICRKIYANNSTLRRHLRIHAYANSESQALAMPHSNGTELSSSSPSMSSSTSLMATTNPSSPPLLQTQIVSALHKSPICSTIDRRSHSTGGSTSALSHGVVTNSSLSPVSKSVALITSGYNPGSDPDIKKPECVGCNKAFARRDTVILHIKNQKRKWDLLHSMLLTLTGSLTLTPTISITGDGVSTTAMTSLPIMSTAEGHGSRISNKTLRQRRSHPYRVVEKLWHSTLQKRGPALSVSTSSSLSNSDCRFNSDSEIDRVVITGGKGHATSGQEQSRVDEHGNVREAERNAVPNNDWPSLEAMGKTDNQTKLQWMMKTIVMPPCWKERKVRLFGAFGVLEEKVLQ